MKRCRKCNIKKLLIEFHKQKTGRLAVRSVCKECARLKLKPNLTDKYLLSRTCLLCSTLLNSKTPYKKYCNNKCKNKHFKKNKPDIVRELNKIWKANNRAKKRQRNKVRYKTDIKYRLTKILRSRLNQAIAKNHKSGSAVGDLGCSIEELKKHIESQFVEGMSWENHSRKGWHIDHIKPLSAFNLEDPEELKKACHYTNLQPLWAKDNLIKGNQHCSMKLNTNV